MKNRILPYLVVTVSTAFLGFVACSSGDKVGDKPAVGDGGTNGVAGETGAGVDASGGNTAGSGGANGSDSVSCPLAGETCQDDGGCCSGYCDPASDSCACSPADKACKDGDDCCSGLCNPSTNTCAQVLGVCAQEDTPCSNGTECCTLSCVDGLCSGSACIQDTQSCSVNGECCSGQCDGNTCTPVNAGVGNGCKSSGNSCASEADCCSGLCTEGLCAIGASYCVQRFDVCSNDSQCCQGVCVVGDGASTGYCGENPVGGTRCGKEKLSAGEVCDGDCSNCCSRTCAPYGPSGASICQPATGCRPEGELCRQDNDCCGGNAESSIPGAGKATCQRDDPDDTVGKCKVVGCNPHGGICGDPDAGTSACSGSLSAPAGEKCCGSNTLPKNVNACQTDSLLVPRCDVLTECVDPEGECSTADDCCNGLPCVQNSEGIFSCFKPTVGTCVDTGGPCTASADCCAGSLCITQPGQATGVCGSSTAPPATGGSGAGGAAGTGGSTNDVCSAYGQSCSDDGDCCSSDVPCDPNSKTCRFGSAG